MCENIQQWKIFFYISSRVKILKVCKNNLYIRNIHQKYRNKFEIFFFQIGSSTLIHATFIDSKVFFIMINVCRIHFLIKSVNLTSHWWRFIQFIINLQYSILHWGIFVCFHLMLWCRYEAESLKLKILTFLSCHNWSVWTLISHIKINKDQKCARF